MFIFIIHNAKIYKTIILLVMLYDFGTWFSYIKGGMQAKGI